MSITFSIFLKSLKTLESQCIFFFKLKSFSKLSLRKREGNEMKNNNFKIFIYLSCLGVLTEKIEDLFPYLEI